MRVLFDITHPAQVHFFKNLIALLQEQGHPVLVTTRRKDVTVELLTALGIPHQCISRKKPGLWGGISELAVRDFRLWRIARRFRPDAMMARLGISVSRVGAVMGVPRIIFDDTEMATSQLAISIPFATKVCTGIGYLKDWGRKQVRFHGFPVLAYLAPRYFTPDRQPLRQAGLDCDRPYMVLRTVAWGATHDKGLHGPGQEQMLQYARQLARHGRVVISTEGPLPAALEEYRNPVPVEHLHGLLAYASLVLGEGGTMAQEAAVLGTPSIFASPLRPGALVAMERDYHLLRLVNTMAEGVALAEEMLAQPDLRAQWTQRRAALLAECIDVTEFMYRQLVETVEAAKEG
jgi:uncharacterized protein